MPTIERDITLTCVSNEVGGGYVGAGRWLGVRLTDVLDRAGVGSRSDQILSTAVDGFTISTPLEVARDGRDAMIAVGMNGEPLTDIHGFPARLVTPGLRVRRRHEVADQAHPHDVCGAAGVLDQRQWATDTDQDVGADRHPGTTVDHRARSEP